MLFILNKYGILKLKIQIFFFFFYVAFWRWAHSWFFAFQPVRILIQLSNHDTRVHVRLLAHS